MEQHESIEELLDPSSVPAAQGNNTQAGQIMQVHPDQQLETQLEQIKLQAQYLQSHLQNLNLQVPQQGNQEVPPLQQQPTTRQSLVERPLEFDPQEPRGRPRDQRLDDIDFQVYPYCALYADVRCV